MQANFARCEEVLLQPRLIYQCDGDIRNDLYSNAVLSGDTTVFQWKCPAKVKTHVFPDCLATNVSVATGLHDTSFQHTTKCVPCVAREVAGHSSNAQWAF